VIPPDSAIFHIVNRAYYYDYFSISLKRETCRVLEGQSVASLSLEALARRG